MFYGNVHFWCSRCYGFYHLSFLYNSQGLTVQEESKKFEGKLIHWGEWYYVLDLLLRQEYWTTLLLQPSWHLVELVDRGRYQCLVGKLVCLSRTRLNIVCAKPSNLHKNQMSSELKDSCVIESEGIYFYDRIWCKYYLITKHCNRRLKLRKENEN